MGKNKDLQPWLDYFEMLQTYERKGFLEVIPDKNEAYIVRSALYSLSGTGSTLDELARSVPDTLRRIRAYAGWKGLQGDDYVLRPFALHVVKEEQPHDLLHTFLLSRRRMWWKLWRKSDKIEIIDYTKKRDS